MWLTCEHCGELWDCPDNRGGECPDCIRKRESRLSVTGYSPNQLRVGDIVRLAEPAAPWLRQFHGLRGKVQFLQSRSFIGVLFESPLGHMNIGEDEVLLLLLERPVVRPPAKSAWEHLMGDD